jgi:hypothetical protein
VDAKKQKVSMADSPVPSRGHETSELSRIARDVRTIRNIAVAWLVLSIGGCLLLALVSFATFLARQGMSTASAPVRPETCHAPHERLSSSGLCFCEEGYHRDLYTQKCLPN